MSADTVPFPTAVGPARTVRRAGPDRVDGEAGSAAPSGACGVGSDGCAEMSAKPLDEGRGLVGAEAADTTCLGDPDLLHDRPSLHLTHAGQRLQQRDDLELADHVVRLAALDDLLQGALGVLEPVLHLGADPPGLRGLLERRCTLFWGQGWKCHASHLLVVRRMGPHSRPGAPTRSPNRVNHPGDLRRRTEPTPRT